MRKLGSRQRQILEFLAEGKELTVSEILGKRSKWYRACGWDYDRMYVLCYYKFVTVSTREVTKGRAPMQYKITARGLAQLG